jgi:hypothetical protein
MSKLDAIAIIQDALKKRIEELRSPAADLKVAGTFLNDWKPTATENPAFKCRCGSNNVWYRKWESNCGGFEDVIYKCHSCDRSWWVESSDS